MKILITLIVAILVSACSQSPHQVRLVCKKDNGQVTFESDYYREGTIAITITSDIATINTYGRPHSSFSLARKIQGGETCYIETKITP
jgi:hypothetical protein